MEAAQVTRKYKRSIHSEEIGLTQKDDIDLDKQIIHGESLPNVGGAFQANKDYMAQLAFNEEPVTIIIEENTRSDFPETHVPVQVAGRGAELLINGKWAEVGWLPVGQEITTKRKFVEVLVRSKTDTVNTIHEDANVERPRNSVQRRTSAMYPISVLVDENPMGRAWLTQVRTSH